MQPVWQTFSVLSPQYLFVQDLFAPTDSPGKEPLLHSLSTYQHSTRAFTPLANTVQEPLLHSPSQYKSLCSTPRSLNTTRAFAPLTVHSTQYNSLCSIHLTTQYKSLYSTQQHITGRFAPLTICTATQYWGLCSTHHLFNNTVQGTGTVQGPLLHLPTQYKSLYSTTHYRSLCFTHHSCNNTLEEPLLHSPFTQQHGTGAFVPLTNTI